MGYYQQDIPNNSQASIRLKKLFLERAYSKDFPGRNDVVSVDALPINKDQLIKVTMISTNSPNMQGAYFDITAGTGYIEFRDKRSRGIALWWGDLPREVVFKCHSVPKLLSIFNGYRTERGIYSNMYKSGMLLEEKDNNIIYHCKEGAYSETFDNIIFSVERIEAE